MRRRPVHLICCVLIAAVSACGHSDAAGGDLTTTTVAGSTTTTVAGSTETTVAGSQIDYGAIALSLMGIWFLVCTRTACLMEWVAGLWGVEPATAQPTE